MSINLSSITKGPSYFGWQSKLDRPIRIATFGDSTANMALAVTRIDTIVPTHDNSQYAFLANICPVLLRGKYVFCGHGGITGNTTRNMLDRATSAYSTTRKTVRDIINTKPDVVIFHGGSVNDIVSLGVGASSATVNAIADRHIALVGLFTACGVVVIDSGIVGYDGNIGTETPEEISARRGYLVTINARIQNASLSNSLHLFVDVEDVLSTNGAFISGVTSDGVHLSNYGAYLLGGLEDAKIKDAICANYANGTLYDFQYIFAKHNSGIPLACSLSKTNVTNQTPVTDSSKMSVVFDVTGGTGSIGLAFNVSATLNPFVNMASGDLAGVGFEFELVDSNGTEVPFTFNGIVKVYNAGNTAYYQTTIINGYCSGKADGMLQHPLIQDPTTIGTNSIVTIGCTGIPIGTGYKLTMCPPNCFKIQ